MAKQVEKAKLEKKPWEKPRKKGEGIVIPRADFEAWANATLSGDRVAAVNVCNKCRQMAEDQRSDVFKTHRHIKG